MAENFGVTNQDIQQRALDYGRVSGQMANIKPVEYRGTKYVPRGTLALLQQQLASMPNPYASAYQDRIYKNAQKRAKPSLNDFQKLIQVLGAAGTGAETINKLTKNLKTSGLWDSIAGVGDNIRDLVGWGGDVSGDLDFDYLNSGSSSGWGGTDYDSYGYGGDDYDLLNSGDYYNWGGSDYDIGRYDYGNDYLDVDADYWGMM